MARSGERDRVLQPRDARKLNDALTTDAGRASVHAVRRPALRGLLGSFGGRVAIIAGVALAVRLLYIVLIAPVPVGLDGDWRFYHSAANLIAQGHFYYRGILGHAYVTAEHPPLYPLVLAVVALFGGVHVLAQRVVGCVIGAASVCLFGLLGRRVGGERAGLLSASIAAVYPPLVVVDGAFVSEPLLVLALLVALLAADRLLSAPTVRLAVALGGVIGVATLAHPEGLLLLPLLAWPAAWGPRRGRATRMLAATAASAVVLAPWVVRNAVVFHQVTLGNNSNTLIAGANCRQTFFGRDIGWWRLDCEARGITSAEFVHGDANIAPALRYARGHLTRLVLVAAVRVLRTFSLYQPLRQGNGQLRRRWLDVVGLVLYYAAALLSGFGFSRMRGRRWPLLAPIWMAVVVSAVGWGIVRFRVPADVSLILLAAIALTRLRWGRRRPGRRAAPLSPPS